MKIKLLVMLAVGMLGFGTAGQGWAVMISPQKVINNSMGVYRSYTVPENMINHSGLITDFTSGVTELSTYLGNNSTGHLLSVGDTFVSSNSTTGDIDFDLGASYEVSTFLLWNDSDAQGINQFELLISDDSSFSNAKSLGTFSASYGAGWTSGIPMQQFSLDPAKGRYVRLHIYNTHQAPRNLNLAQIAEVAFDVTNPDLDGDGVPDAVDACLGTAAGDVVNEKGCSVDQLCPPDNEWMNHGAYVSCVSLTAGNFVKNGLISEAVKNDYVSKASASNYGQKATVLNYGQKNKKQK